MEGRNTCIEDLKEVAVLWDKSGSYSPYVQSLNKQLKSCRLFEISSCVLRVAVFCKRLCLANGSVREKEARSGEEERKLGQASSALS
jgi:hypothetical protein